ncbi:sigma 54-interacting transcriptional regulator [soil metagenome]
MAERILVVEDEKTLCTNVARYLSRAGYTVTAVESGRAALSELARTTFDLVITDLRLPDLSGLDVLDHVRATSPESFVLIMTAYASVESAVEALRRGAHDYVLKPLSLADLRTKVEHIAQHHRLNRENARLRTLLRGESDALTLLRRGGRAMGELCDLIEKVAASAANLLVLGESGTGKELVARAVHERSERAHGPFVTMNVSALPDAMVESYLFGHERGAFNGAEEAREGLFRAASGGTLFLDEVGELPLSVQASLLRAVESKEIQPVGADRSVQVDTRIIAATHRDLPAMVAEGRFRQDLLYRLQVVELRVPALRERKADVVQLAKHFVGLHAKAQRKPVGAIMPEALALLSGYAWPGNVRELSNVIERAVILSSGDAITPVDLPAELAAATGAADDAEPRGEAGREAASPELATDESCNREHATVAFQRSHIARVLDRAAGNREAAAKLLSLSSATFYRYLQKVGLKGYHSPAPPSESPPDGRADR